MKKLVFSLARIALFFLLFALLVAVAGLFFFKVDAVTSMTMAEMKSREDIELCFVGSSTARNHINPALVSELTGKRAFNAAVIGASLQGNIAIIDELLRTNRPEWIVLVVDAYTFNTAKEDTITEPLLMPFLSSWRTRLTYYLNLCREDGAYLDRLLLFRQYGILSPAELARSLGLRYDTEATFERIRPTMDESAVYMGAGYVRNESRATAEAQIRRVAIARHTGWEYVLLDSSRRMLLDIAAQCDQAGAKLLIVVTPNHTSTLLAEPDLLPYTDSLAAFCREEDIPLLNLAYARPELMPRLDAYFCDRYHLGGEGSDIFTEALCDVLNRAFAGEDVSGLFYQNADEYRASIDFITNVWFAYDARTGAFTADCNRGTAVEPEYRYALLSEGGGETILRDYDADPVFVFDVPEGCTLRVFARARGGEQDAAVYFDYPDDYEVAFAE